jgi:hypothetical protein
MPEYQAPEYRRLLLQSIHVTAIKFSDVAASVVGALMEFLDDSNKPSALHLSGVCPITTLPDGSD